MPRPLRRWQVVSAMVTALTLIIPGGLASLPVPVSAAPATGSVTARPTIDLDASWRFLRADASSAADPDFDDSTWSMVNLPHTWNALDGQDGGANYYRGIGWYRRELRLPPDLAGDRLWLEFDGANTMTDVWVNGQHLGQHAGGYARFRFDATAAMNPGRDNVIAVRVNNSADPDVAPLSGDFTMDGGLYRSVRLVATNSLHIDMLDHGGPGLYLRTPTVDASTATVDATIELANDSALPRPVTVRTTILDRAGRPVTTTSTPPRLLPAGTHTTVAEPLTVVHPHLWNGRSDPYLYQAVAQVVDAMTGRVVDSVTQPLGLRTITVDPNTGLFLNGQHLQVHGVDVHQDRYDKGWAVSYADHLQDFRIMTGMGVNAIRTSHYQDDQAVYDLADQQGVLVWTEIPLINLTTDSPAFRANIVEQLTELIRQNMNHPSVMMWGLGNELWNDNTETNTLLTQLNETAHALDPGRFTTYASCCISDTGPLNGHTDLNGYNRYYGWYYGTFADFGAWADALHTADPNRRIGISEYGAGGDIDEHTDSTATPNPSSTWHPEEYQSLFHEQYWTAISARPYLWGSFVWEMFDNASDSRADGDLSGRNDKGLVTGDRSVRKDAYYWYQANWTTTPVVHLNSKSWTDRTDPTTDVKVYTDAGQVTLFVNGDLIGGPRSGSGHVVTWPGVTLRPGANSVVVIGYGNGWSRADSATWTVQAAGQ